MRSKMRRCASRKKSRASISSAAWLNASLWIRIAPSTDFSASRLWGRMRSAATSGIGSDRAASIPRRSIARSLALFGNDLDLHLRDHFPMDLHGNRELAQRLDGLVQLNLALLDLVTLRRERLRDVGARHRPVERVVLAHAPRDLHFRLRDALTERLGLRLLLAVARFGSLALPLDLPLVGF